MNGASDLNSWINVPKGQSGSLLESLDPKVSWFTIVVYKCDVVLSARIIRCFISVKILHYTLVLPSLSYYCTLTLTLILL
jgi:hypothetical protein